MISIRQLKTTLSIILALAGLNGIIYSGSLTEKLEPGLRNDGKYRTWVYFADKGPVVKAKTPGDTDFSLKMYYDTPVYSEYVDEIRQSGVRVLQESRWLNAVSVQGSEDQIKAITALHFVKSIEPVRQYRRQKEDPFDEMHRIVSTDSTEYGVSWTQLNQIMIPAVHKLGYKGSGVRILVLDTGFDQSHPVFTGLNVIDEYDFINLDSFTANQTEEEVYFRQDRHGTIVLSVLAANLPGQMMGAAYEAEYLLAKTEDVTDEYIGEEDNFVAGLEWGQINGADLMTASLGYIDWYDPSDLDGETAITTRAVNIATSLGMSCVVSAGNEGVSGIIAPSDAFNVISVGAVNSSGSIASFSSRGPTFDGRIKPEVCAMGNQTWAAQPGSDGFARYNGTSLAAPLISGGLALVKQAHPEMTVETFRSLILESSSMFDSPDNTYGYGLPDFYKAVGHEKPEYFEDAVIAAPNPVIVNGSGMLDLLFYADEQGPGEIHLFDVTGAEIGKMKIDMSLGLNNTSLRVKHLSSGIYFVQLFSLSIGNPRKKLGTSKFTIIK